MARRQRPTSRANAGCPRSMWSAAGRGREGWRSSGPRAGRADPRGLTSDAAVLRDWLAEEDAALGDREPAHGGIVAAGAGLEHGDGVGDLGAVPRQLEGDNVVGQVG